MLLTHFYLFYIGTNGAHATSSYGALGHDWLLYTRPVSLLVDVSLPNELR